MRNYDVRGCMPLHIRVIAAEMSAVAVVAVAIRDSEQTAFRVIGEGRCPRDSFLVYSISDQIDCVWLTGEAP